MNSYIYYQDIHTHFGLCWQDKMIQSRSPIHPQSYTHIRTQTKTKNLNARFNNYMEKKSNVREKMNNFLENNTHMKST